MKTWVWILAAGLTAGAANVQAQSVYARDRLGIDQAATVALGEVGGGTIYDIELKSSGGRLVWEVDIEQHGRKAEVEIDAERGRVLKAKLNGRISGSVLRRLQQAEIPMSEAMDRAQVYVGGGKVLKIDLDRKDGTIVYEVEIEVQGRRAEILVDAATGVIVSAPRWAAASYGWFEEDYPTWRSRPGIYGYRSYQRERIVGPYRSWTYHSRYYDDDWDDDWDDGWDDDWDDDWDD